MTEKLEMLQWCSLRRCRWIVVMIVGVNLLFCNESVTTWLSPEPIVKTQPPYQPTSEPETLTTDATDTFEEETKSNEVQHNPFEVLDLRLGTWDSSRAFRTFDYAVVGNVYPEISARRRVCLATQTSIENLREILNTGAHWTGPISIAVFAGGNDMAHLQGFTSWLYKCQPDIYSRLALHLVTPADRPAVLGELPHWSFNCSAQPLPREDMGIKTELWKATHPYPQNLLRNVARKNCHTPHVYMVDVDIVPSIGMAEALDQFLASAPQCNLCAYVIPTYELDWSVPHFPANKSELLQLARKNLAVPFHKKVFIYNQLSSNLPRWEATHLLESEETHVSHDAVYKLLYEPFYVAPDNVPPHDERFLGYGSTRNSQVYEMFLQGYRFKVLSPIFTIHWGLQKPDRPRWRMRQIAKNNRKFSIFKKELFARYGVDPLGLFTNADPQTTHKQISISSQRVPTRPIMKSGSPLYPWLRPGVRQVGSR